MNGKVYVGQKALSLTEYDKSAPISGVVLWVDDENCYEAGDETGTVIEQDCPYATQQMANNLLATLQGYSYQGLEANGAKVSPIAELGDGITVNGLYTQLAYQNIRFSTGEVMDVAAPGKTETLHEYQTEGYTTQQFTHQIAETRSLISKTADEIRLEVSNEINGLSASIDVKLDSITSQITGLNGQVSSITQTVDSITSRVEGLEGEYTELKVTLDGVTVTDSSGTTLIKGSSIQTSTLYVQAANITGTLTADQVDLTGAITFRDLSQAVQDDIDDAYSMAQSAESTVSGWTYRSTTYIDGKKIMTGTVMASTLQGGEVEILDENEDVRGAITIQPSAVSDDAIRIEAMGGLAMESNGGNLWLEAGTGYIRLEPNTEVQCGGDFLPVPDDRKTLGFSGNRWTDVYATNGTIQTSDRRQKRDISYDLSRYGGVFDRLKPCSYRFQSGTRIHTGFVAQDLSDALEAEGIPDSDCAAFIRGTDEDGTLGIRYTELIALLVDQVQKLKSEIMIMKGASS